MYTLESTLDALKKFDIDQSTLNEWESQLGLSVPVDEYGRKVYSPHHINLFKNVKKHLTLGRSLDQIREIIALPPVESSRPAMPEVVPPPQIDAEIAALESNVQAMPQTSKRKGYASAPGKPAMKGQPTGEGSLVPLVDKLMEEREKLERKLNETFKLNSHLYNANHMFHNKVKELNTEIAELQARNEELRLLAQEDQNIKLMEDKDRLQKQLIESDKKVAQKNQQIVELRKELEARDQERLALQDVLDERSTVVSRAEALQSQIHSLERELASREETIRSQIGQLNETTNIRTHLDNAQRQIQSYESQLEQRQQQMIQLGHQLDAHGQTIQQLEETNRKLESEIEVLHQDLQSRDRVIANLQAQVQQFDATRQQFQELKMQSQLQEKDKLVLRDQFQRQLLMYKKEMENMNAHIQSLRVQLKDKEQLQQELNDSRVQLHVMERDLQNANNEIGQLKIDVESFKGELKEKMALQEELNATQVELQLTQKDLELLNREVVSFNSQREAYNDLQKKMMKMELVNQKRTEELQAKVQEIESLQYRCKILDVQLKKLTGEFDRNNFCGDWYESSQLLDIAYDNFGINIEPERSRLFRISEAPDHVFGTTAVLTTHYEYETNTLWKRSETMIVSHLPDERLIGEMIVEYVLDGVPVAKATYRISCTRHQG